MWKVERFVLEDAYPLLSCSLVIHMRLAAKGMNSTPMLKLLSIIRLVVVVGCLYWCCLARAAAANS